MPNRIQRYSKAAVNILGDLPGRLRLRWWILTRIPSTEQSLTDETDGIKRLGRYKSLLDENTPGAAIPPAASRYESFRFAFNHFEESGGKVIVELGTIRSFVSGGHPGCLRSDPKYWTPDQCENWDWGGGCFSLLAAECLAHVKPTIHTVDIMKLHIERCKVVTARYRRSFRYHVSDSVAFLDSLPTRSVDLVYLDAGDVGEPCALLQLREVESIVKRDLLTKDGILLIDDVNTMASQNLGDFSGLGKGKYAVPFLLSNGYDILFKGFQYVLGKKRV